MTKQLIKHLCMATMVMGITLATSAGAVEKNRLATESGKANDLFCVFLQDDDAAALAIIKAENNGLARGFLCHLDGDNKFIEHSCVAVTGTATGYAGNGKVALSGLEATSDGFFLVTQAAFTFTGSAQGAIRPIGVVTSQKMTIPLTAPSPFPPSHEPGPADRTVGFRTPGASEGAPCAVRKDAAGGLEISRPKNKQGQPYITVAPSYVPSAAILSLGGADNGVTSLVMIPPGTGGNTSNCTINSITGDCYGTNSPPP